MTKKKGDILGCSEAFSSCDGKCISIKFKVILEDAEEGGYIVRGPALPGCHSQGDTIEEALDNIKEAIIGCLESPDEEGAEAFGSQAKVVEVTVGPKMAKKLPVISGKQALKALTRSGWHLDRTHGSHAIIRIEGSPVTLSVPLYEEPCEGLLWDLKRRGWVSPYTEGPS